MSERAAARFYSAEERTMRFYTRTIITLLAAGLLAACGQAAAGEPTAAPVRVTDDVLVDGVVVPARSAELQFAVAGTVAEVLVAEGERVAEGAPLMRLDDRALRLEVERAEAQLDQARAEHSRLLAGATPEELAEAQARLDQALANQRQVGGAITQEMVSAAQAQLDQARAALARVELGATPEELAVARAAVGQAAAERDGQRSALASASAGAELALQQAQGSQAQAQAAFNAAKANWDFVQSTGRDPVAPGQEAPNTLGEPQRQQYQSAFAQAEAALRIAEASVQQARVNLDAARQAEASGVSAANARVSGAQAQLELVQAGPAYDQLAAALAQVDQAEANLGLLTGDERAGSLAAAAAAVAEAQARLDQLKAGPRPDELAASEARRRAAEAALQQARHALEQGTLRSPIAGTVLALGRRAGEPAQQERPAVVVADTSSWRVVTSDLTELDIVRVAPGMAATLTFDALPEAALPARVAAVGELGAERNGEVVYTVTVAPDSWDERLRWRMSAMVQIHVAPAATATPGE